jgi:prepilin-type N-terminal cleavage/methylation domain-containing protein
MKKTKKGMTLVEIIISIALLGILTVSILTVFSTSFAWIYNYGRKSKAVMEANEITEMLYNSLRQTSYDTRVDLNNALAVKMDESYSGKYIIMDDLANLEDKTEVKKIRFYVKDKETQATNVYGYTIYVCVYNETEQKSATMTFFLVNGGV